MTEKAPRSPGQGQRWLVACLAILLGVVVLSDTLDPVVRAFGLSHAKILDGPSSRVLVLDNLPSADAPSVQTVFQGEIWGRHAFRVQQILLPFLVLLAAMAGLSHLASHHVSGVGAKFFHLRRGKIAPPPVFLWGALFLGGCFAAWSVEGPRFHPSYALIPFVLALLVSAALAVSSHPSASAMARAFGALSASRWFWLGYLALSPEGLFRYDSLVEGSRPLALPATALLACALSLVALHWASRPSQTSDYSRFTGETPDLKSQVERLSLLTVHELWLLLPAVMMGAVVNSLRIEHLAPYLLSSAACALLMKGAVEGGASGLTTWLFRLVAVALMLAFPFAGSLRSAFPSFQPPLVTWLVVIGLCLVLGRPRLPSASPEQQGVDAAPANAAKQSGWRPAWSAVLLGLATLAVLGVALRGGLPLPAQDPKLAAAQSDLAGSFGHQARLLRLNGQALLVGCNLDVARLSLAAEIVSNHLPNTETRVVSVRTRRWERAGRFFLALTVALFLVFPTYLLTFASPGPSSGRYMGFCAFIGGANGAFAVGAALGWFWLDPMPHLAAFLLSISLGWLGLGYARAWVDSRVTALDSTPGLVPSARNTVA